MVSNKRHYQFFTIGNLTISDCRSRGQKEVVMAKRPKRVELLELDIDLRLLDLWRQAEEIADWNLDVVGAFMRAAYGKGYCDALIEESPGQLCTDHGYRVA